MTNKMLEKKIKKNNDKYEQKIKKLEEELEESVKYINIDSKIKDGKQKDINELKNLKDIHEKEIKDLENLKKSNQEPKSRKKFNQEPKSRKKSNQELKSRKRADQEPDHKGKGYVDLPILLSKLNINTVEPSALARSSKELVNNIKQLINYLYDTKQITKQVYNNLIKAVTYK